MDAQVQADCYTCRDREGLALMVSNKCLAGCRSSIPRTRRHVVNTRNTLRELEEGRKLPSSIADSITAINTSATPGITLINTLIQAQQKNPRTLAGINQAKAPLSSPRRQSDSRSQTKRIPGQEFNHAYLQVWQPVLVLGAHRFTRERGSWIDPIGAVQIRVRNFLPLFFHLLNATCPRQ